MVQDDPMCVAARTDGKVLVTGLWVDHSFDIGMPVDPTSVSFFIQFSIPRGFSRVVCSESDNCAVFYSLFAVGC